MVRKLLVLSLVVATVLPAGAATAADSVGFYTGDVPIRSASGTRPCATVKSGGAAYNPSTGAYTVQPITVEFSSVTNCI